MDARGGLGAAVVFPWRPVRTSSGPVRTSKEPVRIASKRSRVAFARSADHRVRYRYPHVGDLLARRDESMNQLAGSKAVVTGGGTGIGLAAAQALAQRGCRVTIVGRRHDVLENAARAYTGDLPVEAMVCDVAERDDVNRCLAGQSVDILVNSHGINVIQRSMAEMQSDDWDRILAVNATGVYNTMAAVLPGMRASGRGVIINVSSVAGKRAIALGGIAYSASKFAVAALGTSVGTEERKHGVRVTTIFPGEVNTPLLDQRPEPVSDERRAQMLQPDDVGSVVAMIASLPPHVHIPELIVKPLAQPFV